MPNQQIEIHTLDNGLTIITEKMTAVRSAAIALSIPAGGCYEPSGKNGVASLLSDLMLRGAGGNDSRAISVAFDNLGVQYHLSPGWHQITFSAATIADRLPETLRLVADIFLRPQLKQDSFEMCKIGREQTLRSIEDEPRQMLMIELRKRCYTPPWNRSSEGSLENLPEISHQDVRTHFQNCSVPTGAILGIAGDVDTSQIVSQCEQLFGSWSGESPSLSQGSEPKPTSNHIEHDSTQTQIGIAYRAVPYRDPDYYRAWTAVNILSGGMSSRLFTKVREERGLCYAIGASLNTLKEEARILCYAGTTNDRAQETLDVTIEELKNIDQNVTESELQRCQARAKSALIMQEESTMARASSLVRDWFHLGHITTLGEVRERIESIHTEDVVAYARQHPASDLQVLTIGPQPLQVSEST